MSDPNPYTSPGASGRPPEDDLREAMWSHRVPQIAVAVVAGAWGSICATVAVLVGFTFVVTENSVDTVSGTTAFVAFLGSGAWLGFTWTQAVAIDRNAITEVLADDARLDVQPLVDAEARYWFGSATAVGFAGVGTLAMLMMLAT